LENVITKLNYQLNFVCDLLLKLKAKSDLVVTQEEEEKDVRKKFENHLHLKDCRFYLAVFHQSLDLAHVEVGDADGLDQPQPLGFLHAFPRVHVVYYVEGAAVRLNNERVN
jgi:hypothetical protein